jgi:hypothetical protein
MRVAARRGPIVGQPCFAGCSILGREDELFLARCIKVIPKGVGAFLESFESRSP